MGQREVVMGQDEFHKQGQPIKSIPLNQAHLRVHDPQLLEGAEAKERVKFLYGEGHFPET